MASARFAILIKDLFARIAMLPVLVVITRLQCIDACKSAPMLDLQALLPYFFHTGSRFCATARAASLASGWLPASAV